MSVSTVRVHSDRDGDPVCVDVALPSGAPVADLLPDLLGLVDGRAAPDVWRLDRIAGEPLDGSLSLADNGVRNGDLLVLSPDRAAYLGVVALEPCRELAEARPPTRRAGAVVTGALCPLLAAFAALALAATAGSDQALVAVAVAAVGTLATAAATVATGSSATGLATVALAGATGFLAVPSAPGTANAFLAATAILCAALLLGRWSGRHSPALMATAAIAFPVMVATVMPMPGRAVGAVLSTTALLVLVLAPRITLLVTGGRGTASHQVLDGLVTGGAIAAATGAVVVALTGSATPIPGIAFSAVLAMALTLLGRTHAEPVRQIVLGASGLAAIVSCLWLIGHSYPAMAPVAAGLLIVGGLATTRSWTVGATAGHVLDRLTCAVLVAVVPAACWAAGVGELVSRFRLP